MDGKEDVDDVMWIVWNIYLIIEAKGQEGGERGGLAGWLESE